MTWQRALSLPAQTSENRRKLDKKKKCQLRRERKTEKENSSESREVKHYIVFGFFAMRL